MVDGSLFCKYNRAYVRAYECVREGANYISPAHCTWYISGRVFCAGSAKVYVIRFCRGSWVVKRIKFDFAQAAASVVMMMAAARAMSQFGFAPVCEREFLGGNGEKGTAAEQKCTR